MTRVLVIEPAGELWGSERALLDLIDSAKAVTFGVCCPPGKPLLPELERRKIPALPHFIAHLHEKPHWRRLQAALGVLRACLAFRPDVLYLNQAGAYRVALPAARLLKLPIVSHVRIFEDAAYLAGARPDPDRLAAIIAISGAIEEEIARHPSLAQITVHRVYDAYAAGPPRPVPGEGRVAGRLACVGRVTPIKGQDVLLEALALEAAYPPHLECLVVGDGDPDYVQRLKRGTPQSGRVRVTWTGFANDVISLLGSCRVLVCPSHKEPLGRVIFEAWDAGAMPVVYGGSGGAAEIVAASQGGVVYPEQTPECLAKALAEAMSLDGAEIARRMENGRAWMAEHCDPEKYGNRISAAFDGAVVKTTVDMKRGI